jgi:hypothetical protein
MDVCISAEEAVFRVEDGLLAPITYEAISVLWRTADLRVRVRDLQVW